MGQRIGGSDEVNGVVSVKIVVQSLLSFPKYGCLIRKMF